MAADRGAFDCSVQVKPSFTVIQLITTTIDIISRLKTRRSVAAHSRRFTRICSAAEHINAAIWVSFAVKVLRIINELSFSVK